MHSYPVLVVMRTDYLYYATKRIIISIPVLIGVSIIVYGFLQISPGDPIDVIVGNRRVSEETVEALKRQYNLNEPVWKQYLLWVQGLIQGDFGQSFVKNRAVRPLIMNRLPTTIALVASSTLVAVVLSVPSAIISAVKQNSKIDYFVTTIALIGQSSPVFLTAIIFVLIFSYWLGVLPAFSSSGSSFTVKNYLMPAVALGAGISGLMFRMLRSGLLDVLDQDYMRTAHAMGIPARMRILKYAVKNALAPFFTVSGLLIGYLIVYTVLVEYVFAMAGIGSLLVEAVFTRDFPLVMGTVMLISAVFITLNLIVDLLYGYFDPRIRYD